MPETKPKTPMTPEDAARIKAAEQKKKLEGKVDSDGFADRAQDAAARNA